MFSGRCSKYNTRKTGRCPDCGVYDGGIHTGQVCQRSEPCTDPEIHNVKEPLVKGHNFVDASAIMREAKEKLSILDPSAVHGMVIDLSSGSYEVTVTDLSLGEFRLDPVRRTKIARPKEAQEIIDKRDTTTTIYSPRLLKTLEYMEQLEANQVQPAELPKGVKSWMRFIESNPCSRTPNDHKVYDYLTKKGGTDETT